jgi:macrolide transport system ATP-binding/permease protein
MTTLMQDVQYALRQLRKTPGFTITVLLTLALGIGANAAIFTLVNAVLLKKLPVADPKMLVRLGDNDDCCVTGGTKDDGNYAMFSTDTYQQLKKNIPEFEELAGIQAGFHYRPVTARRDGTGVEPKSVMGEFISGNYFRTFGLKADRGRLLRDADDARGAPTTAVMSYDTWQREYAGDTSVIGSTFWVNTKAVTVVGIAPQGFYGDRMSNTPPDYYLPIESMPVVAGVSYVHEPDSNWLYIVGRLKPGVAWAPLQDKVNALLRQIYAHRFTASKHDQEKLAKTHATLTPGGAGILALQQEYAAHLRLLMWISGLVLLIACANIANLLLVRGMGRKAEMSVRTAMGAMRGRLIRQLLTESILLSVMGGLAGLAVAYAGTQMLLRLAFPGDENVPIHASPSLEVIGFAFALSLVTGILFGVAPAWIAASANPADVLRSGTRTTATGASLLQRGLVVLQAALSLILLVGAGLFAQSLNKLQSKDLKLDARNRYIVHINPQAAGYSQTQVEALYRTIEERFHMLPGVTKVGIATYTPMEDNNWGTGVVVQGQPPVGGFGASFVKANAEFFDSVGTRVVTGRGIGVQDTSTAPTVAVVNEAFANHYLKGLNPIGQHFGGGGPHSAGDYEIVGVVEDTAYESVRWNNHYMYFVPMMQRPASDKDPVEKDEGLYAGAIAIAADRSMNDMETLARRTLVGINPNLAVVKFQTFSEQIGDRFSEEKMISRLTMLFGGLALLLATIGLYGVTAYTVAGRTPEIGIRMALGAERGNVVAMIMRGATMQIVVGLAIGIPVALACVRFVKAQLYEITKADGTVMAGAVVTLVVAACIAGLIPARRAASIDPAKALRME